MCQTRGTIYKERIHLCTIKLTEHNNMQEHIEDRIPANCEQKEMPSHKNKGKLYERLNT